MLYISVRITISFPCSIFCTREEGKNYSNLKGFTSFFECSAFLYFSVNISFKVRNREWKAPDLDHSFVFFWVSDLSSSLLFSNVSFRVSKNLSKKETHLSNLLRLRSIRRIMQDFLESALRRKGKEPRRDRRLCSFRWSTAKVSKMV